MKTRFGFSIPPGVIDSDRSRYDIACLDRKGLFRIGKGSVYIEIGSTVIELHDTEVVDYLIQLKNVVAFVDAGSTDVTIVSRDYFSNSIDFVYHPDSGNIQLIDPLGGI